MLPGSIYTDKLSIGWSAETVVQKDLTFALQAGELVCLLGTNGCGKSTLLQTLAGLIPPLAGEYHLVTDAGRSESVHPVDERPETQLAFVLTEKFSLENTTVHDVVALGRYPYTSFLGGLTDKDEKKITEALELVGLPVKEAVTFFNQHSDGEKQRILIAKALAQDTPIILLDEPTAHLDLPNRIQVLKLLRRLAHEQGKTVLLSTHELELALQLSDRILLMSKDGIELNNPQALKESGAFEKAFGMDVFTLLK